MPDSVARRGPNDEGWRWGDSPPPPPPPAPRDRRPRAPGGGRTHLPALVLTLTALAVLPAVIVAVVLATGADSGGSPAGAILPSASVTASPRPSPTAAPTPLPTPSPAPTATPAPASPAPTPEPAFSLALWSQRSGAWTFGDMDTAAGYQEGQSVPFLVRLHGAAAGAVYDLTIVYDCRRGGGAGFDFLAGGEDYGEGPATAGGGPGRARPDAAIPVPDDGLLTQDDGFAGLIELWGGRFLRLASGPLPESTCTDHKVVQASIQAASDSLYIISSAHLAVAAQWSGKGAASAAPFGLEVTVRNVATARLNMLSGSVAP